jgi:hypothetical protein
MKERWVTPADLGCDVLRAAVLAEARHEVMLR